MKLKLNMILSNRVGIRTCSDYSPFGVELDGRTVSDGYRYGYQRQERDDEVKGNGNSVNYTFRMHDPRLGRFFAVDPLAFDYPYYSPYQFSGNSPIGSRELEGLEPDILFNSVEDAAKNFGQMYNGRSILNGVEYGTNIYKVMRGSTAYFYYEVPNKGNPSSVTLPSTFNNEGTLIAQIHSHGEYLTNYQNNKFSNTDMTIAESNGVDAYVATTNGSLRHYDVETNKVDVVSTNMPSDPKDPDRKNTIDPQKYPKSPIDPDNPPGPKQYYDPFIPKIDDPHIVQDNLNPNNFNSFIPSHPPIKKLE